MKGFRSTALLVIAAAVGGLLTAFLFSQSVFKVADTTIEARIFLSKQGFTQISVPPLGEIRAGTHGLPVGISISIERITVNQIKRLASAAVSQEELIDQAEDGLGQAARRFVIWLLLLGALGGLGAGLLLPRRNWKRAAAAVLVGLTAVALPGYAVKHTYDLKAWRQPKYTGMLTAAPWLLGTLEEKLNDLDAFRAEMRVLAGNLGDFYAKVENWEPIELEAANTKVLHVGDIHNNPAAVDLIEQVVHDFDIDFVIDTGDFTDLGTPLEATLVSRISSITVPYVFVPGNHESEPVLAALRNQPNVLIADNRLVDVKGLSIFGASDPSAYEFSAQPADGRALTIAARNIADRYASLGALPDIAAVHSVDLASKLIGRVPVILVGHTHQPSLRIEKGTIIDDVGTTGAAGLRNFEAERDMPYSLKVLYFSKRKGVLTAVDSLALSAASRDFVLERRLVAKDRRLKKPSQLLSSDLRGKPSLPE